MSARWYLALALAVAAVGAAPGPARADRPRPSGDRALRVAQATPVEQALAAVTQAQRAVTALAAERVVATRRYDAELAEIDQLKRTKASWRRDRALRSRLASSLETAKALTALTERVRRAEAELARTKAAAVAAIDRASTTATPAVRRELARRRLALAPPAPTRRIVLPDDKLDPLADPEELDDQAAALREAEAALVAEVGRLDRRATRFDQIAELRRQHDRAESMTRTDDDDVRRVAVRAGSAGSETAAATSDAPASGGPPGSDFGEAGVSGRDLAIALASVVDARTVDVLRQSDRSRDPGTWAAASRQAKDAVAARLDALRKRRLAIEARARELRRP
ncbi:MAG: hypothetical protein R3B06_13205 [Kofleriaceae bacterium]